MIGKQLVIIPVVIPNGTAVMAAPVDLSGLSLVGLEMPAAWTAANLTFQASGVAAASAANMYDSSGVEYTVTVSTSRYVPVSPVDFIGVKFLVVRSGTGGTPVAQGADRTINLICRSM